MKLVGVISTAVLSLALGAATPAFTQDQHEQEEQKAKPAENEKKGEPARVDKQEPKAQTEKNSKPEEKNAQQEKSAKPEEKNAKQEPRTQEARPQQQAQHAGGGRIPADRYKANFGREHSFRVSEGDYRNHRFEYGGYSFGFIGIWPSNWLYTQNVYVIDIDGVYYLCNPMYPGVNLELSFAL
jgi:DNA mismatch repair ATPase MutL